MDQQQLIAQMRQDLQHRRLKDRTRVEELAQRQTFVGTSKGRALSASPAVRPSRSRLVPPVSVVRGATIVHHVTLLSTFNQSIASGGGRLQWEWFSEAAPNQRRGFTTLAANQVPTFTVPVDITGVMNFRLTGSWGEEQSGGETVAKGLYWREAGAITVRLRRQGATIGTRTYPAGRVVSATYEVIDDGWEVVAGDVLEVELPNSSPEAQRHRQAELTYKIIELAQNAVSSWEKIADVDAWGITQDSSGNWWTTEGAGETVSQYDSAWRLLSSFEQQMGSVQIVRGITFDGTNLWITGNDPAAGGGTDQVHETATDGTEVSEFTASGGNAAGLAWDGTDLWFTEGGGTAELRRYSTDGTLLQTINLPGVRLGLAYYDGKVVLVDNSGSAIEVRDPSDGTLLQTIDASEIGGPTGVWVDSDRTLYASKDGDGVYRWMLGAL